MHIVPKFVAVAGAGLAALTTGAVLVLGGTAAAQPTDPAGSSDVVITTSVPVGAGESLPQNAPKPTATVRAGQPVPQDPNAPAVITVKAEPGATLDQQDAPRPTATITATPAP